MEATLENEVKGATMKAEINLGNLQKALKVIAPAIPGPSSPLQQLRSVRIEQLDSGLALQATDIEVSVRAMLPQFTQLTAPLTLASDRLVQWIKLVDGDAVKLTANASRITVQCGKPKVFIPRLNHPFPTFNYDAEGEGFEIPQSDLLRILKHTIIAVGDEERYALNGVLLEADGETLYAVATDGHRMVIYSRPLAATFRYLLPERMMRLILPVIAEGKGAVRLQEVASGFLATVGGDFPVSITCQKPSGAFPTWYPMMPESFQATMTVSAEALLRSMGRCLLMGDQKTHAVGLEFAANAINLKAVDAQAGEAEEAVDAVGGPATPVVLGVNGTYLAQALKQITGDLQVMLPDAQGKPILFRSEPVAGEVFNYIVMPMRINR